MSYIVCDCREARNISAAYLHNYTHGFPHPDRIMEEHDLIYMCAGEWEIYLEEAPIVLKQDMVLFLPAGIHHSGVKKCLDGTRTMFIHVSAKGDRFQREGGLGRPDTRRIPIRPVTDCIHAQDVKILFENIIAEYSSDRLYKECRMSALFQLLITELHRVQQTEKGTPEDSLVKEALRIIRENPDRFHTSQELAGLLHVSPRTLTGHFGRALGTTPHQYELNMKLDSAAAFLREYPDVKLYEVAKNFGFYDEFHLSRAFSQKFSVSPARYRKYHKGS